MRRRNVPDTTPTKLEIAPEVASPIIGALEMQLSALDKPFNLEFHTCVDERVKVAVGVLQR